MRSPIRFRVLWGVGGPYPWNHLDWYKRGAGWYVLQIGQLSVEVETNEASEVGSSVLP